MRVIPLGLVLLAAALALPAQGDTVAIEKLLQSTTSWDGEALPPYASGQPEITILKITIPPGQELEKHLHTVINAGVLLSGRLTVMTEGQGELQLEAGDALLELVDKWHYGKNEGDEPAVILVFYAGVEGQQVTVPKGENLSASREH